MAALKTRPRSTNVRAFIDALGDAQQRRDCRELARIMRAASAMRGRVWGTSIVGYGRYHYCYSSGREGDWMVTGFAPRKGQVAVYIMPGFDDYAVLLRDLGRYKTGKSCLYLRQLDAVDRNVLTQLITRSVNDMRARYVCRT